MERCSVPLSRSSPHLRELYISSTEQDEVIDLNFSLSSSPRLLCWLYLKGRLEKIPQWVISLQGFTRIDLAWSRLKDDPLESLLYLPNLVEVYLTHAYGGEGLCLKAGSFLKLKKLHLR